MEHSQPVGRQEIYSMCWTRALRVGSGGGNSHRIRDNYVGLFITEYI